MNIAEFEKFSDKHALQPDETSLVFEILKQEGVEIQEESEEIGKELVFDNIEAATDDSIALVIDCFIHQVAYVENLKPLV